MQKEIGRFGGFFLQVFLFCRKFWSPSTGYRPWPLMLSLSRCTVRWGGTSDSCLCVLLRTGFFWGRKKPLMNRWSPPPNVPRCFAELFWLCCAPWPRAHLRMWWLLWAGCEKPPKVTPKKAEITQIPAAGCAMEPWLPQNPEQSVRALPGWLLERSSPPSIRSRVYKGCKSCLFSYSELPFAPSKEQKCHSTRAEIAPLLQVLPCSISRGTHSSL